MREEDFRYIQNKMSFWRERNSDRRKKNIFLFIKDKDGGLVGSKVGE